MIRRQHTAPVLTALSASLALAACAHGGDGSGMAAAPLTEQPADARTQLYADCAGSAVQAKTVTRFGHYVRFNCTGAPAKAMYDALDSYSRLRGQEITLRGRTTRHISSARWDDQCWTDRDLVTGAASYGCFTHQPASADFIDGKDTPSPKKM